MLIPIPKIWARLKVSKRGNSNEHKFHFSSSILRINHHPVNCVKLTPMAIWKQRIAGKVSTTKQGYRMRGNNKFNTFSRYEKIFIWNKNFVKKHGLLPTPAYNILAAV